MDGWMGGWVGGWVGEGGGRVVEGWMSVLTRVSGEN